MIRKVLAPSSVVLLAVAFVAAGCTDMEPTSPTAAEASFNEPSFNQGQGRQQTVGSAAGSLGKVTLDAEVGWDGSTAADGEFITAERQGVVIGLRAMERHVGLLEVTGDQGNRVGVYEAKTGPSPQEPGFNNGTWNYDWHVDLSNATGNARGKTIEDYKLVLEQDFTEQSLFGALGHDPVVLAGTDPASGDFFAACADAILTETRCQQSWNPGFGNTDYDPDAERTYNLRLVLTPETFNGPPLAVAIRVNVNVTD